MAAEGASAPQPAVSNKRKYILSFLAVCGVGLAIALAVAFTVGKDHDKSSSGSSGVKTASDGSVLVKDILPKGAATPITSAATNANKAQTGASAPVVPPKSVVTPVTPATTGASGVASPADLVNSVLSTGANLSEQSGVSGMFGALSVVDAASVAS